MNFLNAYLTFNLLIGILCLGLRNLKLDPRHKLRLYYFGLPLMLGFVMLQPLIPGNDFAVDGVKVWAASVPSAEAPVGGVIGSSSEASSVSIETVSTGFHVSFVFVLLLGVAFILREYLLLRRLQREAFRWRAYRRIELLLAENIASPFSHWSPGKLKLYFPQYMIAEPTDLRIALRHELQHHRHGDTIWVYPLLLLRGICCLNPLAHLLCRDIAEAQEQACDAALLGSGAVNLNDYIGCLIRVAETIVPDGAAPATAAGFCFEDGRTILKRRIKMMTEETKYLSRKPLAIVAACLLALMSLTTYAGRNLVQDRRLSMEEAREFARRAQEGSEFPIVVNEAVLEQLNKFVGTPQGRKSFKEALERKESYKDTLEAAVVEYKTPSELNAIPIAESGYRNLPARTKARSAGLWMFIPSTARAYGMKVSKGVDERLDVAKETSAAHRYLKSNHLIFNDWLLAVFSYNVGEQAVARGIAKYKTRDVWELSKHIRGDADYLQKVMAAVIVMKSPELLD